MIRSLAALSLLTLLAACGQKGALYLPDPAAQPVPAAPQMSPAEGERSTDTRKRIP